MSEKILKPVLVNHYLSFDMFSYVWILNKEYVTYTDTGNYSYPTLRQALKCPQLLSYLLDYPDQPYKMILPLEVKEMLFNEELDEELSCE